MNVEDLMIPCLSKTLFGVECLGCGMQRSLLLLFQGEFIKAFYMYPPVYAVLLLFFIISLHFFDKSRSYNTIIKKMAVLTAVIMVISYTCKQLM